MNFKKLLLFLSVVAAITLAFVSRTEANEAEQPKAVTLEQKEKVDEMFFFINYDHRDVHPIYINNDSDSCVEDCKKQNENWFQKFEPIIQGQGSQSNFYVKPSKMQFFNDKEDPFVHCKNVSPTPSQ